MGSVDQVGVFVGLSTSRLDFPESSGGDPVVQAGEQVPEAGDLHYEDG
jgi:hypothetical protein